MECKMSQSIFDLAHNGNKDSVLALVREDTKLLAKTDTQNNDTPLHVLLNKGYVDLALQILTEYSDNVSLSTKGNFDETLLHTAVRKACKDSSYITIVKKLVELGSPLDLTDEMRLTPLSMALSYTDGLPVLEAILLSIPKETDLSSLMHELAQTSSKDLDSSTKQRIFDELLPYTKTVKIEDLKLLYKADDVEMSQEQFKGIEILGGELDFLN
jgi:hypothetical protein